MEADDFKAIIIFLIIQVILSIFYISNIDVRVTPIMTEQAQIECEKQDGLNYLLVDNGDQFAITGSTSDFTAICNNGVEIEFTYKMNNIIKKNAKRPPDA